MRETAARDFSNTLNSGVEGLTVRLNDPRGFEGERPIYKHGDAVALAYVHDKLAFVVNLNAPNGGGPIDLGPRFEKDRWAHLKGLPYAFDVLPAKTGEVKNQVHVPLVGTMLYAASLEPTSPETLGCRLGSEWYGQFDAPDTDQQHYGMWQAGWSRFGSAMGAIRASTSAYLQRQVSKAA